MRRAVIHKLTDPRFKLGGRVLYLRKDDTYGLSTREQAIIDYLTSLGCRVDIEFATRIDGSNGRSVLAPEDYIKYDLVIVGYDSKGWTTAAVAVASAPLLGKIGFGYEQLVWVSEWHRAM